MTMFVTVNQSFFMGLFFFISAMFIEKSLDKKGARRFLLDRLKRLGIPLVFYSLVLSPILNYTVEHYGYHQHDSFTAYMSGYHHWIDFGVLWFTAALLIFDCCFVIYKHYFPGQKKKWPFPTVRKIFVSALLLGLCSFLVRLVFPVGWTLKPLNFQLGYFSQYIFCFIMGIISSRSGWTDHLNMKLGKRMRITELILALIVLPFVFTMALKFKVPLSQFDGGWNIFSFAYALWDQCSGLVMVTFMLCLFHQYGNRSTLLSTWLSRAAYGAYIFHPLILITISLFLSTWNSNPLVKLLIVCPLAVSFSFAFGWCLTRLPVVKSII
jgi:membrane-bound acyltransferase YfiQ involved in biofilm formation